MSLPNTALHQKSCWCNRERLLVNAILVTEDWPSDRDKESGVTVQDLTQVVEQERSFLSEQTAARNLFKKIMTLSLPLTGAEGY